MIPIREPDPAWLRDALGSVIDQSAATRMEIVLVDGGSPAFDARAFVRGMETSGRVECADGAEGIGPNWNRCVELARGDLVHLMHQDDRVLPGFYDRLQAGFEENPGIGAAFTRCLLVDERGRRMGTMGPRAPRGVLESWREDVFVHLRIAAPAMVVRRSVYEEIGGFDDRLRYALDWDMWKRIAARRPIWYEPEPGVAHRAHRRSTTRALQRDAGNMREIAWSIARSEGELPDGAELAHRARSGYARFGVESALKLLVRTGDLQAARAHLREARALSSTPAVLRFLVTEGVRGALGRLRRRGGGA